MIALNYVGAGLMGVGAILMIWVIHAARLRRALLKNPVHVLGMVVDIRFVASSSSDSPRAPGKYYPTVQYKSEDGQTIKRELPASGNPKWKEGDWLRLIHQRGAPLNVVYEDLRWADLVSTAIGSLIVFGIGVLLCFFVESTPAQH